jgi:hypothetical protein
MTQFFETRMGQRYYEGTMPSIARSLEEIAKELTKSNECKGCSCKDKGCTEVNPDVDPINKDQQALIAYGMHKEGCSYPEGCSCGYLDAIEEAGI